MQEVVINSLNGDIYKSHVSKLMEVYDASAVVAAEHKLMGISRLVIGGKFVKPEMSISDVDVSEGPGIFARVEKWPESDAVEVEEKPWDEKLYHGAAMISVARQGEDDAVKILRTCDTVSCIGLHEGEVAYFAGSALDASNDPIGELCIGPKFPVYAIQSLADGADDMAVTVSTKLTFRPDWKKLRLVVHPETTIGELRVPIENLGEEPVGGILIQCAGVTVPDDMTVRRACLGVLNEFRAIGVLHETYYVAFHFGTRQQSYAKVDDVTIEEAIAESRRNGRWPKISGEIWLYMHGSCEVVDKKKKVSEYAKNKRLVVRVYVRKSQRVCVVYRHKDTEKRYLVKCYQNRPVVQFKARLRKHLDIPIGRQDLFTSRGERMANNRAFSQYGIDMLDTVTLVKLPKYTKLPIRFGPSTLYVDTTGPEQPVSDILYELSKKTQMKCSLYHMPKLVTPADADRTLLEMGIRSGKFFVIPSADLVSIRLTTSYCYALELKVPRSFTLQQFSRFMMMIMPMHLATYVYKGQLLMTSYPDSARLVDCGITDGSEIIGI